MQRLGEDGEGRSAGPALLLGLAPQLNNGERWHVCHERAVLCINLLLASAVLMRLRACVFLIACAADGGVMVGHEHKRSGFERSVCWAEIVGVQTTHTHTRLHTRTAQ